MSQEQIALLIAGLAGAGVGLLSLGTWRARRRLMTSRHVASMLGLERLPRIDEPRPHRTLHVPNLTQVRGLLARMQTRDTQIRPLAVALACVAALIGLASVSMVWILLAAASALLAWYLGARERRRRRIESQALNAMQLLSSGLRAGYSVPQAVTLVARHSPEPTAFEFGVAAREIGLGIHLADAIARLATRTANPDYALVAIIIRVQHEVGGNLAQILDSVASTLRERMELRRQVNALTAQQRLSSMVLTILPFGLLLVLFAMDRTFVDPLFSDPIGRLLLAAAGVMVFIGWTIMRSMGRVEV